MLGGEVGSIKIFRRKLFVLHYQKFRRGIRYCFTNFGLRKTLDIRGGENNDFPSKLLCLTVPKHFVGQPFFVLENFCYRKIFRKREGGSERQDIPSKTFCVTLPKNFVEESVNVSLISGVEKF